MEIRFCKRMLNYKFIIYCVFIAATFSCGPGGGRRGRLTKELKPGGSIPRTMETSPFASGSNKNCSKLVQILATNIVFKDPSYRSEARRTTKGCSRSLITLAGIVEKYWDGDYKLYVHRGYTTKPPVSEPKVSTHRDGRAFDISLTSSKFKAGTKVPSHALGRLGELAIHSAGFTYVKYVNPKNAKPFIHVSCPCGKNSDVSRCFPGDSVVRLANQKTKHIKDITVGDSVLTLDSNGKPVYSDIIMMMHQNKHIQINDYVQITNDKKQMITLSAYHLIFVSDQTNAIFSKDVEIGHKIITYDETTSKAQSSAVTHIARVSREGMYAPLTESGTIIVDDVYASCYALFPSHDVSHAMFLVWRTAYRLLKFFEISIPESKNEYNWYPNVLRKSLNYLNILPYKM